jgi:Ca2+-binding RTX toxin-like protein
MPNNPAVAPNAIGALLLSADNKNRIRFIPTAGYTGITNSITYRGWNQRFGGNGEMINISGNFRTVASMQVITNNMSVGSNTAQINVLPVNTAPTLDPLQVITSSSFNSTVATTGGILVSNILSTAVTDPDSLAQQGIAITSLDSTNGTWQYSINGQHWIPITSASDASSLLLDSKSKLRFVRNSGYSGAPGDITIRAWDQTNGTNGGQIDTTVNGGTSSVSSVPVLLSYVPPVIPVINSSSPGILVPITPSPAAPTPAPVIAGDLPIDNSGVSQTQTTGGSQTSTTGNATTGTTDNDCPCEQIIAQKQPNPVIGTIGGTNGDDQLAATSTANTVYGLQENDIIFGTASNDNLFGGAGNDTIRGGWGNDFVRGGQGSDTLYGGRSADVIKGGRGNDTIYGGRGADFLSGGKGADTIYGGRGNDFISGGKGNDRLFGGAGDDYLCGCGGADILRGGKGNDTLNGEKGNDLLIGGAGDDVLTGGAGSDRFRIQFGRGTDLITDFTVAEDFLELARGLKTSDLLITQDFTTQSSGATTPVTVIGLQPGTLFPSDKPLAVLLGVTASTLTPNNFLTIV